MATLRREETKPEDALPASDVLYVLREIFLKNPNINEIEKRYIQRDVASRHMWLCAFVAPHGTRVLLFKRAWQASSSRTLYYALWYCLAKIVAKFRTQSLTPTITNPKQ